MSVSRHSTADEERCLPVNRTLHVAPGEERECVARVDSKGTVDGFDPAPLARRVVLDLQGRDGLTEEQSKTAQIYNVIR